MKYLPSFNATNTWNLVFGIDAKVSITSVVLSLFQIFSRFARKLVQGTPSLPRQSRDVGRRQSALTIHEGGRSSCD